MALKNAFITTGIMYFTSHILSKRHLKTKILSQTKTSLGLWPNCQLWYLRWTQACSLVSKCWWAINSREFSDTAFLSRQ